MIKSANKETIKEAANILQNGRLVGMPTETVYGLAANALDGKAVAKIFEAKGRPSFNPLITHFAKLEDAKTHAAFTEEAHTLAQKFWPGPLTMILPRKEISQISELVSAGLPTLAVRIPSHKTARSLIETCGFPLAAPSANQSGTLSPTSAQHVANSLGDKVDMILADGNAEIGLESTVIDLSVDKPILLRPGAATKEDLEDAINSEIELYDGHDDKPKSPGMLLKHYAPSIPVRMNAIDLEPGEALLAFGSDQFMGIKGGGAARDLPDTQRMNLSENQDLYEAASHLFKMLHALDQPEHKAIAVMAIPENGIGAAINDRLKRAAASGNMPP